MKDPQHITSAIMLLQMEKVRKTLPWWLVPLDLFLAGLYLIGFAAACVALIYLVVSWL